MFKCQLKVQYLQYDTEHYDTMQCNMLQCSAVVCSAVQFIIPSRQMNFLELIYNQILHVETSLLLIIKIKKVIFQGTKQSITDLLFPSKFSSRTVSPQYYCHSKEVL